jgi:parallel beta-helix repeat protein
LRKRILVGLLLVVLVTLFSRDISTSLTSIAIEEHSIPILSDYEVHNPILITSNDDFETQGWPGSGTPEEPYVIEGLSISGASDAGIDISFVSAHFVIKNCLITSCQSGISTVYTGNATIANNTCNNNVGGGIYLREESNNITIINNTCNLNQMGIYFWSWYGSSTNVTVAGNTCDDNSDTGIFLDKAVSVIVANNTCYGNGKGISPHYATFVILENNTTYGGQYGIKIDGSTDVSVRQNIMRGSHYAAQDTDGGNFFDSNYYHDYYGLDENDDGIGDTPYDRNGVFDIHPMMFPPGYGPPTINHPNDIEIESGSTGHSIVWTSSPLYPYLGLFPYHYELCMNGTSIGTGSTTTAEVYLDGLDIGLYNYSIVITDDDGHSIADTVFVTVADTIPPYVDSPDDFQYESGTTGHNITWSPSDPNPVSYEILRNGTKTDSGPWDGSDIEISIDGLDLGNYNFTIVVLDISGNTASDTVMVSVVDTTTSPPADFQFQLIAILGIGIGFGVVISVIVFVIIRKR